MPATDTPNTAGDWLSYPQAAERLGITQDAVRQRVKRGTLLASRGNDGKPRILLGGNSKQATNTQPTRMVAETDHQPTRMVVAYDNKPTRSLILSLETRISELLDARTHERQQQQQAIGLLVERVDAAELRTERLEDLLRETLEHQRRPWWRRWLGR